mgnify:CR=1 FL=1
MSDPNLIWWIDDWEQVRQNVDQVTEEAVKRVQASSAQARQIQVQIKQDKAVNNNLANFLEFLLKNIKSDDLMAAVYNTFFKVTDPKTWAVYFRKKINNIVIIWFFAPFFRDKINEYNLSNYYDDILPQWNITLGNYLWYIKNLSKKHHDNIPISKESLLNLLYYIMVEFGLLSSLPEKKQQMTDEIKNALK